MANSYAASVAYIEQAYRTARDEAEQLSCEAPDAAFYVREGFALACSRVWAFWTDIWNHNFEYDEQLDREPADRMELPYRRHRDIDLIELTADAIMNGDGAALFEADESFFDFSIHGWIEEFRRPPYRQLLRLQDRHIERFLSALAASGPGAP